MKPGLSLRVAKPVANAPMSSELLRTPERESTAIDLSCAQNEAIRPELLDIFKKMIQDEMTTSTFALPTTPGGDPRLRKTLSKFFDQYFKPAHPVEPEHIVLTAGASDAIEHVIHAVCDEGDSILIPGPYWPGFEPLLSVRPGVNIVTAHPPTYNSYASYLVPSMQAAYDFSPVRDRIKAVMLSNPSNPLGRCFPRGVLIECLEFCQERGLHLIVDELYALTDLEHVKKDEAFISVLSLLEPFMPEGAVKVDPERVHVIWSASKLFGVAGLRVGCFISQQNPDLVKAMALLTATHANTVASLYLDTLLSSPQLSSLIALNSARLSLSYRILADCLHKWRVDFIVPTHGLFVFARLGKNAVTAEQEKWYFDRLTAAGLKVGTGQSHNGVKGDFGWARIRFSVTEGVMKDAVTRLDRLFDSQTRKS